MSLLGLVEVAGQGLLDVVVPRPPVHAGQVDPDGHVEDGEEHLHDDGGRLAKLADEPHVHKGPGLEEILHLN